MPPPGRYDAIILGAGAAGLMCAAEAGLRGARCLVLDHAAEPGRKILISGGGRCNFTNVGASPGQYLSANPHFAKSALRRYTPADFIALVDAHGIGWHEKTLGQLFCDNSARDILGMLLARCAGGGVDIRCGEAIRDIGHADALYSVGTDRGLYRAPRLVVATGGPSIAKIGGSGIAYDIARRFGLKVVQPRPALVPLTLPASEALFRDLAGISANVAVRTEGPWGKARFREAALFTHRGLSGPAILQVSSYWQRGQAVMVDFFPDAGAGWLIDAKRDTPRGSVAGVLRGHLPQRLADALAERLALRGPLAGHADRTLAAAAATLGAWPFQADGSEGFAKAEVTAGGVSTADLSSQTLAAMRLPTLHVIGEAVDVTGWLGGYNFQWAWASGFAAATAIAAAPDVALNAGLAAKHP